VNPLKKLLGQTAIYGLSSIIGRLLNYLLVPLFTRAFLPHEFGVVAELYAYVGFFIVFLTLGLETGFFRFSEKNYPVNKVFSTALVPILVTSIVFILFALVFSQSAANFIKYPENKEYIIWFALIIGFDVLASLPFAKLRQEGRAIKFAILKFTNIFINIGGNIFFLMLAKDNTNEALEAFHIPALAGFYSEAIGVGYIFIINLVASASMILLFIPDLLKTKFEFSKDLLKQMLIYSTPLLVAGLAGIANEVIDRILLKFLIVSPSGVGDSQKYVMSQIGIYGANYKLSILMTLFIQAFRYAAEPFFFAQNKEKNAKNVYADVMKYFVIFCLLIFLGVTLYIDIVKDFISEPYWEGLKIVPILLFANLFLGVIYNLSVWYKLTDKTKYGAGFAIFGATITLVLNIILIPKFGYLGAAWATFFCYFSMMIASYLFGQKHFKIKYPIGRIAIYCVFALSLYFAFNYFEYDSALIKYSIATGELLLFLVTVSYFEKLHLLFIKK